ncbi:MAG: acetate kinase [Ruminococcus sp.]|nr:acetate kinase [Ruminococcus sp.]MCD7801192.1 acetate kinase [Ruminococcus sp.]
MKKILVINAGSSSLKYQLIDMDDEKVIAKGNCDRIGIGGHISYKTADGITLEKDVDFPTHTEAFNALIEALTTGETKVIQSMDEILAVGHRVVQGAEVFTEACIATDEVIAKIDELAELAPVHNHAHVLALNACKSVLPANVPQVVVFDTSFHQTMPEKAYMYALPYECYEKFKIRKYGFHGTSHRYVSQKVAELIGKDVKDLKIISCHLGNGSSITAIQGGKSIDTTMGFTPLDGLIMGTRCGSIDASAVTYLQEKMGLSPKETSDYLNKKSGFIGVSGISSDNRDITKAKNEHNHRAEITSEMLCYEIKKYIGSFMAVMNGADVILFTGGIGENAPEVRAEALSNLENLGIKLDTQLNEVRGKAQKISTPDSKVEVWVVPTNEELLIARDTLDIISKQ